MLTLEDCIALSELSEEEIDAIAEHEHLPEIVAAELGYYLFQSDNGRQTIRAIIRDDIAAARIRGDFLHSAKLKLVLRHFVEHCHERAPLFETRDPAVIRRKRINVQRARGNDQSVRRLKEVDMTTVQQLLHAKGRTVWSIHPNSTVFDAVAKMAEKDIGALVVMDNGRMLGMITERDYARNVVLKGKTSPAMSVGDIMETRVIVARPHYTVAQCMAMMTEGRARHLPVLDGDRVIGIISIGDLVKSIIDEQEFMIEQLEHYIHS